MLNWENFPSTSDDLNDKTEFIEAVYSCVKNLESYADEDALNEARDSIRLRVEYGPDDSRETLDHAVRYCTVDVAKFVLDQFSDISIDLCFANAIIKGRQDIAKLLAQDPRFTGEDINRPDEDREWPHFASSDAAKLCIFAKNLRLNAITFSKWADTLKSKPGSLKRFLSRPEIDPVWRNDEQLRFGLINEPLYQKDGFENIDSLLRNFGLWMQRWKYVSEVAFHYEFESEPFDEWQRTIPVLQDYYDMYTFAQKNYDTTTMQKIDALIAELNDNDESLLRQAARNGMTHLMELLLENKHYNPFEKVADLMNFAFKSGSTAVVRVLLSDERFPDPYYLFELEMWDVENHQAIYSFISDERVSLRDCQNFNEDESILQIVEERLVAGRLDPNDVYIPWVIEKGRVDTIRLLLNNPQLKPHRIVKCALAAIEYDQTDLFELAWSDPRVNAAALVDDGPLTCSKSTMESAFKEIEWDQTESFESALSDPRVYAAVLVNEGLLASSKSGNIAIFKRLFKHPLLIAESLEAAFIAAVKHGHLEIVKIFLVDGRIDPIIENGKALTSLVEKSNYYDRRRHLLFSDHEYSQEVAQTLELLLADSRVDLSVHGREMLWGAAFGGNHFLLKTILNCDRIKLNDKDVVDALLAAVNQNKVEVLKVLLQDARINPAVNDNEALFRSASQGNQEIVKVLLDDGRVSPEARNGAAFISAAKNGHVEVVKLFLARTFTSFFILNEIFRKILKEAAAKGKNEVVKLLLSDNRVSPAIPDSNSIPAKTLKLLLSDPRIDSTAEYVQVIRILLQSVNFEGNEPLGSEVQEILNNDAFYNVNVWSMFYANRRAKERFQGLFKKLAAWVYCRSIGHSVTAMIDTFGRWVQRYEFEGFIPTANHHQLLIMWKEFEASIQLIQCAFLKHYYDPYNPSETSGFHRASKRFKYAQDVHMED